jgi:hypothetical protein
MRPSFFLMVSDKPAGVNKKKFLQALYLNISDQPLLDAVDVMKFDVGETEIRVRKGLSGTYQKPRPSVN